MKTKKKIVVLTGAGMSAESGISTFRDANGLWEKHSIEDVASPEGWKRNPALVLEFYNQRRRQLFTVKPNLGHLTLVDLETAYDVTIVTQNVDDLHERAGSTNVLHLHGSLLSACSERNKNLRQYWDKDIVVGDLAADGAQLRPDIVWFGELVPNIDKAGDLVRNADFVIVIGSSMQVYPAAGLVAFAPDHVPVWYVDPKPAINYELKSRANLTIIEQSAALGVPLLVRELIELA